LVQSPRWGHGDPTISSARVPWRAIRISGMQPPCEATNGKRAPTVPCRPPYLLCSNPIWQGSRTPTCSSTAESRRSRPSVHRNAAALPFFLLLFLVVQRAMRCDATVKDAGDVLVLLDPIPAWFEDLMRCGDEQPAKPCMKTASNTAKWR